MVLADYALTTTTDHLYFIICRYLHGVYAGAKLYCFVKEARVCVNSQSRHLTVIGLWPAVKAAASR